MFIFERSGFSMVVGAELQSSRQIFVAYPYKFAKADYRRPFNEVAKAFGVKFVFADEKISDLHIMDKIRGYISTSAFGIYDVTGWNANVALELGLALGIGKKAYIAFNPSQEDRSGVPSDLQGMDRLQYSSYSTLEEELTRLISQFFPVPVSEAENQIDSLRAELIEILRGPGNEGLKIGDVAKVLGISTDLAKLVVKPMVGDSIRAEGSTRATKYFSVN